MLDFPEMNGQTRLPKPEQHSPLPMFLAWWPRSLQRLDTLATLFGDKIFLTILSPARFLRFPRWNWPFPVSSALNCPDFAATVTAQLLLSSYLCRIKRKENSSYSGFIKRTPSAGSNTPPSWLSCIWASPARHLRHYFFHFDLWSRHWGVVRLLSLRGVPLRPHPTDGIR